MGVIINKARRGNNFYLPVDELIKLVNRIKKQGNKRENQTDREREREAGYECRKFIKSIRGRGRERNTVAQDRITKKIYFPPQRHCANLSGSRGGARW